MRVPCLPTGRDSSRGHKKIMMNEPQKPKEQFIIELDELFKKYELRRMRDSFFERTAILIIAAAGLIAALAWEDALKQLFKDIFGEISTTTEKIFYSLVVTGIAVLISLSLGKAIKKRVTKNNLDSRN